MTELTNPRGIDRLLAWSRTGLTTTTWVSAGLFGLYILASYVGAMSDGDMERWNQALPRLYAPGHRAATAGIGAHFIAGGIILALGFIQFVERIRLRAPAVHRWLGRLYVAAAIVTGLGGTLYILLRGTIGGMVMDVGFGLYGLLTVLCAERTYHHARTRQWDAHRAWALRLLALALGSWLYRIEYGFWLMFTDGAGHTRDFHGPFDQVMAFFFFIPNLILVELMLRSAHRRVSTGGKLLAISAFAVATGFLVIGTYYFTRLFWGPAILGRFVS